MMVDFAIDRERNHGLTPERAIYEACLERFRPIMMTTASAILGALPLVVATGTGSELRRPLGITIVGGLLVSQILTLYTTPVIYLLLDRLHRRLGGGRRAGEAQSVAAPAESLRLILSTTSDLIVKARPEGASRRIGSRSASPIRGFPRGPKA